MNARPSSKRQGGFTLVELLVALGVLALMALVSWRGLDAMTQTQARTQQRTDDVLALQAALNQWSDDLDALAPQAGALALDWNGRALRLTRRSVGDNDGALRVVAWTRRDIEGRSMWLRWQSPALRRRDELQAAWLRAAVWAQTPDEDLRRFEVRIAPLNDWQLFYFRQDAWTNPLSSAGASNATSAPGDLPDGVRLILQLPSDAALSGQLTRDWARPTLGGNKS